MRDSSHATATSSGIDKPVSRDASRNASTNAVGIPQEDAVAVALFGAVARPGAISTRVVSAMNPSRARASTTDHIVRQLTGRRRRGSARFAAARRRDVAKTRSTSAKLCQDALLDIAASYPCGTG
jgi:hypothetical protein